MSGPIKVGEFNYQVGKLDALRQFHVMRRLSGVASALGQTLSVIMKSGGVKALLAGEGPDPIEVVEPLMKAVSTMSDADSDFVIMTCLSVVSRQVPGGTGWSPVTVGGNVMFQDMSLPIMLQLVWRVLEDNLSSFFSALPSGSLAPEEESSEGSSGRASRTAKAG